MPHARRLHASACPPTADRTAAAAPAAASPAETPPSASAGRSRAARRGRSGWVAAPPRPVLLAQPQELQEVERLDRRVDVPAARRAGASPASRRRAAVPVSGMPSASANTRAQSTNRRVPRALRSSVPLTARGSSSTAKVRIRPSGGSTVERVLHHEPQEHRVRLRVAEQPLAQRVAERRVAVRAARKSNTMLALSSACGVGSRIQREELGLPLLHRQAELRVARHHVAGAQRKAERVEARR